MSEKLSQSQMRKTSCDASDPTLKTEKQRVVMDSHLRRKACLASITVGSGLASLQSSAIIVALPDLMRNLNIDFITIIWVISIYILFLAAPCTIFGFIGSSGVKGIRCRIFNYGFLTFTIGTILCGLSQSRFKGTDLLIYRSIQGIGSGLIFSTCFTIATDKYCHINQTGFATSIINIAYALGIVLGPVIGGASLKIGWSWIFFINVPLAVIGTISGFIFCRDTIDPNVEYLSAKKFARSFDYLGSICLFLIIALFFVITTSATFPSGKISETKSLVGMGMAILVLSVVFLVQEGYFRGGKRSSADRKPVVDLKMFRIWDFTNTVVVGGITSTVVRVNMTYALIFLYQGPLSKDPLATGSLMVPFGAGFVVGAMPSGKLADKYGFRYLCVGGALLSTVTNIIVPYVVKPDSSLWTISLITFFNSVGWGIYASPSGSLSGLCVPAQQRAIAGALRITFMMISQMLGTVICFKVILGNMPPKVIAQLFISGGGIPNVFLDSFMNGWRNTQWIMVGLSVVCMVVSCSLRAEPINNDDSEESTALNDTKA